MERIKENLRILSTNWIHFLGFYITTYFSLILFKLIGLEGAENDSWESILFLSLFTIPLLFFVYGLKIMGGFLVAIFTLDIIGFTITDKNIRIILFFQWLLIIPPFIVWAVEYQYWLWLTLIISFFFTQFLRENEIRKIKKRTTTTYKNNA
ncbi:MAG: hypothetical protein ACQEWG_08545 [Bacteroidota bacterium]